MIIEHSLKYRLTIFFLCSFIFFSNIALTEEVQTKGIWKCFDLLDSRTKSSLSSQERFFAGLFQLPGEYSQATEAEKARLISQWIKELQGRNFQKITEAAAYLGIVKANEAVKPLEKVLAAGKGGGRLRWVCTRSLGQIGEKSSIPLLINLIDNNNRDTRIYARVSLAEITGVYLGDDKEKWKNWEKAGTLQLGTSKESKDSEKTLPARRSFSKDKLDFVLPDIYGRIVDSQDYVNVPVLVMSGACWCGGCQQDSEPLRKIATEYAGKGLATIRTVAGDNELAALDFQKHYRLGFVQLLDTNRTFEKRYNRDGWTFLMLSDAKGKIVYKVNSPSEKDWLELRGILNKMLSVPVPNKTIMRDGISYMPATLQRSGEVEKGRICERFPSIACGPDGRIYVVFTTNRNGSSDVFIRVFDGSKWSEDMPVAATKADEYDGTVLIDKQGHIRVCWTSNAGGKNYDIFVKSFENTSQPRTLFRLTNSKDDAMHPRMACDEKGRVWVTYYKWHKMGRYSRDKEVYIRKYENGRWSNEVQVSPTDVPQYEDHSEPAIAAYGNCVIVGWSWDFHPPNKGYSNEAKEPTIFVRRIDDIKELGKISSASCKNIDVTPSLAVLANQQIWCCWDSLSPNQLKSICVSKVSPGLDNRQHGIQAISKQKANVCTPTFATSSDYLTLLWSDTPDNKNWALKYVNLDVKTGDWGDIKVIESEGNPRYCSAAYDSYNRLWLAYSVETEKGREIVTKTISNY